MQIDERALPLGVSNNKKSKKMENMKSAWRVHTPNLLKEVASNPNLAAARIPLQILAHLLARVGERAVQLNDKELNALMIRLTIYSVADPDSPDFNQKVVDEHIL